MPTPEGWERIRSQVDLQSNFLFNPLPPGPGVCEVCRGAAAVGHQRCYNCNEHRLAGARVLVLDDTWTKGGHLQSLAHVVRSAGAAGVVALVLGRHMGPDYSLNRPILDAVRDTRFDITRCALCPPRCRAVDRAG